MQFNQPFKNTLFNDQCYTYPAPFQFTNVIGEGDVTSLLSPDGSVQYYFTPLFRRDRWSSSPYYPTFQAGNPTPWPVGPEAWFIRRINSPIIPNVIQDPLTNVGDPFLKSYYAYKGNVDVSPQNNYFQKFHNDNVTSTTDIHYFYPSLRRTNVKYSTGVQVDVPLKSHKCTLYEIPSSSNMLRINKNKIIGQDTVETTDSAMSIDEKQSTHRHKKDYSVSFKNKKSKRERRSCRCESNNKTDKKIMTYSDQASGCVDTDGRETQTVSRTESDVNTVSPCGSCCRVCDHCINDSNTDSCE